jgi:hypothetical protein
MAPCSSKALGLASPRPVVAGVSVFEAMPLFPLVGLDAIVSEIEVDESFFFVLDCSDNPTRESGLEQ